MREAVLLFAAMLACGRAASSEPSAAQRRGMPAWAVAALQAPEFATVYELSARLDPSLLHGDFDGDGQLDQAVLVSRRETGAQGIAFLHAGSPRIVVVGAGHALGNGGDDFSWMDAWSLLPSRSIPGGAGEPAPPAPSGDALLVEKLESASAIVYWDGKAYRWHQQGD